MRHQSLIMMSALRRVGGGGEVEVDDVEMRKKSKNYGFC